MFGDGRARGGGDVDLLALLGALVERLAVAPLAFSETVPMASAAEPEAVGLPGSMTLNFCISMVSNGIPAMAFAPVCMAGPAKPLILFMMVTFSMGGVSPRLRVLNTFADAAQIAVEIRADHGGEPEASSSLEVMASIWALPATVPSPRKAARTSEFERFTPTAAPTAAWSPTAKPEAVLYVWPRWKARR